MESVAQSTQGKITVASLDLVAAERPDVHVYSELLIQWRDDKNKLRRVVPDNMVVIAEERPRSKRTSPSRSSRPGRSSSASTSRRATAGRTTRRATTSTSSS